jgi:hypothetical protein
MNDMAAMQISHSMGNSKGYIGALGGSQLVGTAAEEIPEGAACDELCNEKIFGRNREAEEFEKKRIMAFYENLNFPMKKF